MRECTDGVVKNSCRMVGEGFFLIWLIASLSVADECADFCVSRLDSSRCSDSISCEDGFCVGITWTNREAGMIGISNSTSVLDDRISCHIALTLMVINPEDYSTVATSITPPPTLPSTVSPSTSAPESSQAASGNVFQKILQSVATYLAFAFSGGPSVSNPVEGDSMSIFSTRIEVHYKPELTDYRPRINVTFLYERELKQRSVMLDTASDLYALPLGSALTARSPCVDGYFLSEDASSVPQVGSVRFGTGSYAVDLPITRRVDEVALLSEVPGDVGFTVPVQLSLTSQFATMFCMSNPGIDGGLFGASFASSFSKHVDNFSLIPGPFSSDSSNGMIIINDEKTSESYCTNGDTFHFFPLNSKFPLLWAIDGVISVNNVPASRVSFVLDTGASNVYVTKEVYRQITDKIQDTGSSVKMNFMGATVVTECFRNYNRFPIVRFRFSETIFMELGPMEYLKNFSVNSQICELDLAYSAIHDREDVRLMGMRFLDNFVTLFDRKNARIGLCNYQ